MIQLLWRIVWRFLKKLGIELPYDSTIPLLGIYSEKTIIETDSCTLMFIERDSCTLMFIAALFTIVRDMEET